MFILTAVVYLSYAFLFCMATICLACGLYYLAELVEEYTIMTKKILRNTIFAVLALHFLIAIFENLPWSHLLLGIVAHVVYFSLLASFPFIDMLDKKFIASCVLAVGDHFLWFRYFTNNYYPFSEILGFFLLCVWLVPFGFFISLSANENALPGYPGFTGTPKISASGDIDMSTRRGKSVNRLLALFNFLKRKRESVLPEVLGSNTTKLT
eukprot:TRINITY_DN12963_c0_g1_i1.p1 TRINITY_DN12963_c0_g1~~TRINITY_DN12963_c0_g1_i1.p1  ORF type:complete len:210 (-),score=21.47 TRINITY_DN12963_c0_g1_i1:26-655(-)